MFTRREFTLRNTKGVMEQPLGLSDGAGRQDALAERGRFSENHRAGIQGVFVGYYLGERDADLVRIFPHHAVLFFFTGRRGFGSLAESLGHAVGESDHHVSGVWRITGGGGWRQADSVRCLLLGQQGPGWRVRKLPPPS